MDLLRFILRLPFTLVKGVCRLLGGVLSLLGRLLRPLVGNLSWRAPAWWAALPRGFLRLESGVDKHPKAIGLGLLLLAGAAGGAFYGWHWWQNRPQPIEPAPMVVQELGLVGKAVGRYNLHLGGNREGTRIPRMYRENINEDEILSEIDLLVGRWAKERNAGEGFGDFTVRAGIVKPVLDPARDFWE